MSMITNYNMVPVSPFDEDIQFNHTQTDKLHNMISIAWNLLVQLE